jgi:thiol-disulfide isomerase/thioredoxin
MKTGTVKTAPLLLFVIMLHAFAIVSAQSKQSITLQVGDNAPSISMYKWLKGEKVTGFKKGSIYVVEFGATWCTPCAAMIPHLSEISKKYKGAVNVISVFAMEDMMVMPTDKNPAYVARVQQFVKQRDSAMNYSIGVDGPDKAMEKSWLQASGMSGLPHTFVIDKDGKIAWTGIGAGELKRVLGIITSKSYTLDTMLSESMKQKLTKTPYDYIDLLLINGNGGNDTDFLFRSVLVKSKGWMEGPQQPYIDGYNWFDDWIHDSATKVEYTKMRGRIQSVNMSLMNLYYLAYGDTLSNDPTFRNPYRNYEYADTIKFPNFKLSYGKYWFTPILEVKEESPFYPRSYGAAKRYHYGLTVKIGQPVTAAYLKEIMQRDLQNYFGYYVTVENRAMPYWKIIIVDTAMVKSKFLTRTPGAKFGPPGLSVPYVFTNASMRDIIWVLGSTYGYVSFDYGKLPLAEQGPFIDETGIKGDIDFEFDKNWSFEECRKYFNGLGLDIVKSKKEMKVVVIRDPKE